MKEKRVFDILVSLTEHFRRGDGVGEVRRSLVEKGHSSGDIDLALSYLLLVAETRPERVQEQGRVEPKGVRVLHELERLRLAPEAYGHLLKLRELNIVTPSQLEEIMDDVLFAADEVVGVEELKAAVARLLQREAPLEEGPERPENLGGKEH